MNIKQFMRINFISLIWLLSILHLSGAVNSQTINVDAKRMDFKSIFKEIERQTDYLVFAKEDILKNRNSVYVNCKAVPLRKFLDKVFVGQGLEYKIIDKMIVLSKQEPSDFFASDHEFQAPIFNVVSGTVVDINQLPIKNVTVKSLPSGKQVVTSDNGSFEINTEPSDTHLSFSIIGYSSQTVKLIGNSTIKVVLLENVNDMDEVVVVGMNVRQTKRSITGSLATIETKELKQSPVANLNNALAGRLPGLISVQNSGQPGSDAASLYIRGISTYGGNTAPLIVIDGLPRGAESFSNIDPNEVESISILKDASSSALYGIQGANGVVVVTTKRGSKSGAPQINSTSQFAYQQPVRLPENMSSYELALLSNRIDINNGNLPRFDDYSLNIVEKNLDPYLYPNVNWFDEILKSNSPQFLQNLNMSGSSEKVRYFVSGSFLSQGTMLKYDDVFYDNYGVKSSYDRYNFRSNIDIDATKNLTVQVDLAGRLEKRVGPGKGFEKVFSDLSGMLPYAMPIFNKNGTLGAASNVEIPFWTNPYGAVTQNGYYSNFTNVMYGTISATHNLNFITNGLAIKGNFSFENNNFKGTSRIQDFNTFWYRGYDNVGNEIYQSIMRESKINSSGASNIERTNYLDLRLVYDKKISDHNIGVQLMGNRSLRVFNDELPYAYQGISGRATYDFKSKYFTELNMAYNGSENFPPDRRYGLFPSVSMGWILSDENFFPESNSLNLLKLRGSYGVVGNDKSGRARWLYLSDYTGAGAYRIGINNSYKSGLTEGTVGNEYVTWEKAHKSNIGVDISLFNNSISLTFDVFKEIRKDILTTPGTVPSYVGINNLGPLNSGEVVNQGFDMDLRFQKKIGNVRTFMNFNLTYTQNKVTKNDQPSSQYEYQNLLGYPVGYQLGYKSIGFFKDEIEILTSAKQSFDNKTIPGDMKYMDINGDGVINPFDRIPIQVHNIPNYMMGLSLGLDYKGFDVSLLLNAAFGSMKYSRPRMADPLSKYTWTPELGEDALMPVAKTSSNNELLSNFWVRPSDYLKIRNAEIGYAIPRILLEKIRLKNARIFLNGQNLAMWDNAWIKDRDPETNGGGYVYPVQRVVNFGINIGI